MHRNWASCKVKTKNKPKKQQQQLGFKVITSFSSATFESKKCVVLIFSLFNERWENILKCWGKKWKFCPLLVAPSKMSPFSVLELQFGEGGLRLSPQVRVVVLLCSCRRGRDTKWSSQRGGWWDTRTLRKLRRARSGGTSACMSAGDEHATHRDHAETSAHEVDADDVTAVPRNVVHASDSPEGALRELQLWFQGRELLNWDCIDQSITCEDDGKWRQRGGGGMADRVLLLRGLH